MTQPSLPLRPGIAPAPPQYGSPAVACVLAALVLALLSPPAALAHPGALDEFGGHFDERTGEYHYHRPSRDMAARKSEYLTWKHYPLEGSIKATVASIESASSIWVMVDYRPAYQDLAQRIAKENRDDRQELLRVDLAHVSPEETGARNLKFEAWFRGKVATELKDKLLERQVTVKFRIVGGAAARLRGMVFVGSESINVWMVLNGWSYYLLGDVDPEYDAQFRHAEDVARRDKAGIWQFQ